MHRLTEYRCDPELTDVLIGDSYAAALWLKKQGVRFQPGARPAGLQGRRQVQVLGRARLPSAGRRRRSCVKTLHEAVEKRRHRGALRHDRRWPHPRARPRRRACAPPARRGHRAARQGRGARLRRLRIEPRDARALSRAQLGSRQGARHALQQRRRATAWPRASAPPRTATGRAPFRALGHQRAALRRPHRRRPVPEAQLSVRHHRQRARASATSTRAPTSTATPMPSTGTRCCKQPGLFAWQVFDAEDRRPAARGVSHLAHHQGDGRHASRSLRPSSTGVDAKAFLRDRARVQRGASPGRRRSIPTSTTACAPAGLPSTRPTGRTRSIRRRTTPMASPPASPSRSAACTCRPAPRCRTPPGASIRGLYAAGEMVGGLYFHNYGSGTGLVAGVVFGRIAGREAAKLAAGSA